MSITLEQYSEKAIVLFGETEKVKDRIKALGGKYNSNLKGRPGWVFTNSSRPKLEAFLKSLEEGGIDTPASVPKVSEVGIESLLKRIEELELRIQKLEGKPSTPEPVIEFEEPEPERPKRLLKRK